MVEREKHSEPGFWRRGYDSISGPIDAVLWFVIIMGALGAKDWLIDLVKKPPVLSEKLRKESSGDIN